MPCCAGAAPIGQLSGTLRLDTVTRPGVIAAIFALVGLVGGFSAGWHLWDESPSSTRYGACPQAARANVDPLKVSIGEDIPGSVTASMDATVESVPSSWRQVLGDVDPAGCIFAGDAASERPGQVAFDRFFSASDYDWDEAHGSLRVVSLSTQVKLDSPGTASVFRDSETPPVVSASLDGADLLLRIDLCGGRASAWACVDTAAAKVVVGVPSDRVGVVASPLPTAIKTDGATRWRTWETHGDPAPIVVRVPLTETESLKSWVTVIPDAMTALSLGQGPVGTVSVGQLAWTGSSLLLACAFAVLFRRYGGAARNVGVVVLVGLALLAASDVFYSAMWDTVEDRVLSALAIVGAAMCLMRAGRWSRCWQLVLIGSAVAAVGLAGSAQVAGSADGILAGTYWSEWLTLAAVLLAVVVLMVVLVRIWSSAVLVLPVALELPVRYHAFALRRRVGLVAGLWAIASVGVQIGLQVGWASASSSLDPWDMPGTLAVGLDVGVSGFVLSSTPLIFLGCFAGLLILDQSAGAGDEYVPTRSMLAVLALIFAALAGPADYSIAGVAFPVWLITFAVAIGLARRAPTPAADAADRRELLRLGRQSRAHAVRLLALGPHDSWRQNAAVAAAYGMTIGIIPMLFFLSDAIDGARSDSGGFFLNVVGLGLVLQIASWTVLGFTFGAVYRLLPGPHGLARSGTLAAVYGLAALSAGLLGKALGTGSLALWVYASLQVVVYLSVVAVAYDLLTVRRAGGSFRDLGSLYRIQTVRQSLAYLAPLTAAVIGLVVEIQQGSGAQLTEQFLQILSAGVGK